MTDHDKMVIYGAALCRFLPKKYRRVERDWSFDQTYEIPPVCVNTNLLVASFAQSCIDIAASTRENTASIDPRVFALFSSAPSKLLIRLVKYKGRRSRRSRNCSPLRIRASLGNSLKFFEKGSENVPSVMTKFGKIGRQLRRHDGLERRTEA